MLEKAKHILTKQYDMTPAVCGPNFGAIFGGAILGTILGGAILGGAILGIILGSAILGDAILGIILGSAILGGTIISATNGATNGTILGSIIIGTVVGSTIIAASSRAISGFYIILICSVVLAAAIHLLLKALKAPAYSHRRLQIARLVTGLFASSLLILHCVRSM